MNTNKNWIKDNLGNILICVVLILLIIVWAQGCKSKPIKEDNSVLKEYILNQNKTKDSMILVLEGNYLRTLDKIDSISNLTANSTTVINKHYHEKDSIINTYYYKLDTLDIVFSASINRITENSYQGKYDIPLLK
jgi:hypothetical protein